MLFHNVCLESFGYLLPDEIVTSEEIERRLAPLYQRLRLPEGRLELMTGIRERRFFEPGARIGAKSLISAQRAMAAAGVSADDVGVLVHGSVSRDFVEPATASGVHHQLGLRPDCLVYDVSNACLGLLNGIVQVATLIELGQVRAGLVVGTEDGRRLVESTIAHLNEDTSLTRESIKSAIASLTIGSASAAVLLVDRELSRTGNQLTTAVAWAETGGHSLCQGGAGGTAGRDGRLLMETDSEGLLRAGVDAADAAFAQFQSASGWAAGEIQKTIGHQVGQAHRRLLLDRLGLSRGADFSTFEWLGNTGAVALPVTTAIAVERGWFAPGDRVGLLGIGSGINVLMLGVEWGGGAAPLARSSESRRAAWTERGLSADRREGASRIDPAPTAT